MTRTELPQFTSRQAEDEDDDQTNNQSLARKDWFDKYEISNYLSQNIQNPINLSIILSIINYIIRRKFKEVKWWEILQKIDYPKFAIIFIQYCGTEFISLYFTIELRSILWQNMLSISNNDNSATRDLAAPRTRSLRHGHLYIDKRRSNNRKMPSSS